MTMRGFRHQVANLSYVSDKSMQVTSLDQHLVLARIKGREEALADRCANRGAALSVCMIVDGQFECPYHGWRYEGRNGRCMIIPNLSKEERVPKTYRVPAYAVEESDGFIHIWSQGDGAPETASPSLAPDALGPETRDAALIAYPYQACIDLLLDAPDIILNIPGVAIVNQHRFGDPSCTADEIDVRYAAIPASRRGKGLASDYPFQVRIRAAAHGGNAHVLLTRDNGNTVAAAHMTFAPVRRTLCTILAYGSRTEQQGSERPMHIGIKRVIDPTAARDAVDYVSRFLK